ncbi:hypothetical protein CERZMDRAFT_89283 [Cercospora zeae-maydis SCOH1-5]|uniref:Uncharacterized protein n=1 Tax=Cercospora zeae-maydis SCOH1-5 TaxID=717836 RepID=A0A6A6EZL8_9PEZI|nr:hypothetical protein CERZMDRAFT_89283 [Cercospora zeae-maydis SCOH1-5]
MCSSHRRGRRSLDRGGRGKYLLKTQRWIPTAPGIKRASSLTHTAEEKFELLQLLHFSRAKCFAHLARKIRQLACHCASQNSGWAFITAIDVGRTSMLPDLGPNVSIHSQRQVNTESHDQTQLMISPNGCRDFSPLEAGTHSCSCGQPFESCALHLRYLAVFVPAPVDSKRSHFPCATPSFEPKITLFGILCDGRRDIFALGMAKGSLEGRDLFRDFYHLGDMVMDGNRRSAHTWESQQVISLPFLRHCKFCQHTSPKLNPGTRSPQDTQNQLQYSPSCCHQLFEARKSIRPNGRYAIDVYRRKAHLLLPSPSRGQFLLRTLRLLFLILSQCRLRASSGDNGCLIHGTVLGWEDWWDLPQDRPGMLDVCGMMAFVSSRSTLPKCAERMMSRDMGPSLVQSSSSPRLDLATHKSDYAPHCIKSLDHSQLMAASDPACPPTSILLLHKACKRVTPLVHARLALWSSRAICPTTWPLVFPLRHGLWCFPYDMAFGVPVPKLWPPDALPI